MKCGVLCVCLMVGNGVSFVMISSSSCSARRPCERRRWSETCLRKGGTKTTPESQRRREHRSGQRVECWVCRATKRRFESPRCEVLRTLLQITSKGLIIFDDKGTHPRVLGTDNEEILFSAFCGHPAACPSSDRRLFFLKDASPFTSG